MVEKMINGRLVKLEPVTFHLPSRDVVGYRRVSSVTTLETTGAALQKLEAFGGEQNGELQN